MQWRVNVPCLLLMMTWSVALSSAPSARSQVVHAQWQVVNDSVMGGVSSSQWSMTPQYTGQFRGTVSLENYGGFASVRGQVPSGHFKDASTIRVRLKGDGKVYKFCIRTQQTGSSISYQHSVQTSGEWQTVELDLKAFVARWRGRRVDDAPTLNGANINGVGFLIADKQAGSFSLLVSQIEAAH
jgi:hypothetical protein